MKLEGTHVELKGLLGSLCQVVEDGMAVDLRREDLEHVGERAELLGETNNGFSSTAFAQFWKGGQLLGVQDQTMAYP